jgi:hypothetical protein
MHGLTNFKYKHIVYSIIPNTQIAYDAAKLITLPNYKSLLLA